MSGQDTHDTPPSGTVWPLPGAMTALRGATAFTMGAVAERAARAAEHATQTAEGTRQRLEERFDHVDGVLLRHEAQLERLGHSTERLERAIGDEPSSRASIADMSPADVEALASQGLRPAVHAMLAVHAAERAQDLERQRRTEAHLQRVERVQNRSTSLLAVLLVTVTALQESGALKAILQAVVAALSGG